MHLYELLMKLNSFWLIYELLYFFCELPIQNLIHFPIGYLSFFILTYEKFLSVGHITSWNILKNVFLLFLLFLVAQV